MIRRTNRLPRTLLPALLLALCLSTLFGCKPSVTGYMTATDPRETNVLAKDKSISTEILARFAKNDRLGTRLISPFCYDGHVFLVGEYDQPDQPDLAEALAREVEGVRSVTSHLLPRQSDPLCDEKANDALALAVLSRLDADEKVQGYNIDVKALQCYNIVLLGLAPSQEDIDRAAAAAAKVTGVREVASYIRVYTPKP
ncbi:MAG: BON domain-containing protein [Desulfovibrionaceae bacterium]